MTIVSCTAERGVSPVSEQPKAAVVVDPQAALTAIEYGVRGSNADTLARLLASRGDSSYLKTLISGRLAHQATIDSVLRANAGQLKDRPASFVQVTSGAVVDFAAWPDPLVYNRTTSFAFSGNDGIVNSQATYRGTGVNLNVKAHSTNTVGTRPSVSEVETNSPDLSADVGAQVQCIADHPAEAATLCGVGATSYSEWKANTLSLGQPCGVTVTGRTVAISQYNYPALGAGIDLLNSLIPWKLPQPAIKRSTPSTESDKNGSSQSCVAPIVHAAFGGYHVTQTSAGHYSTTDDGGPEKVIAVAADLTNSPIPSAVSYKIKLGGNVVSTASNSLVSLSAGSYTIETTITDTLLQQTSVDVANLVITHDDQCLPASTRLGGPPGPSIAATSSRMGPTANMDAGTCASGQTGSPGSGDPTPPASNPGLGCHWERKIDRDVVADTLLWNGPWYISCIPEAQMNRAPTSTVPLAGTASTGACTPIWGTTRPTVATVSATGIVTGHGAGDGSLTAICPSPDPTIPNTIRAVPLGVKSPTDASNVTNGGCSDGYIYGVTQAASDGSWLNIGQRCLGGGTPTQTQANPTASPSTLTALDLSHVAIQSHFASGPATCGTGWAHICDVELLRDDSPIDPRHPQVQGGAPSVVGGEINSYPATITYRYNGQIVQQRTVSSPQDVTSSGAPVVTMSGLQDGQIVVASFTFTGHDGITLTSSVTIPVQFPPDPDGIRRPTAPGVRNRMLRDWALEHHRVPNPEELRMIDAKAAAAFAKMR